MKRPKMNPKVQVKIVNEYKEKTDGGEYRYSLKEIADMNGLDLHAVNNILAGAGIRGLRGPGPRRLDVPSPRVLKILRDYNAPGVTLEQVGVMNARMISGRPVPLTKQRIQQIVARWKPKYPRKRRFSVGDLIRWDNRLFRVVKFYNNRKGAVHELDGSHRVIFEIDPFYWSHEGSSAKLVKSSIEDHAHRAVA